MEAHFPLLVLLLGGIIVLTIVIRSGLKKAGIPSLIGFMVLGVLIRMADSRGNFLTKETQEIFEFLANIGVITLLFRVGLESNLKGLLNQIRHASIIWTGNIVFSGLLGYWIAHYWLGLEIIPSLFIGVSLTATSVGVSISVWQEAKAVRSPTGELLLDVAEMDDISGIILMALLLSAAPALKQGLGGAMSGETVETLAVLLLKLIAFGILCVLFSLYIEKRITRFFSKMKHSPDPMLMIAGFGFIIASVAGLLGFSLAMGAFFAGLVFSRDPKAVRLDTSFGALYDFFVPFFFIAIGLNVDPGSLASAFSLGLILLAVAVIGKLIGNGVLSLMVTGWASSALISVSMVPRAEIAMIVMQKGSQLGGWAVPNNVYSAMVFVSLATCVGAPFVLRLLLKKWPQSRTG
ncbi:MAG: cation:proton antiporter [Candidatus Aminicenantes bacterium]